MGGGSVHRQKSRTGGTAGGIMQKNQTRSRGSALLIIIVYTHMALLLGIHTAGIIHTLGGIAVNDQMRLANKYAAEAGAYLALEQLLQHDFLPATSLYEVDGEQVKVAVLKQNGTQIMIGATAPNSTVNLTVEMKTGRIVKWSES